MTNKLKILIADDHPIVRKGFTQAINTLSIVGEIIEAENGYEAIELSNRHAIDLFILDFKMPKLDGYDAAKILLKKDQGAKVIILTSYDESALIINLFRIGVRGFLVKNTDVDEIEEAIKTVAFTRDLYYNKSFCKIITEGLYGNSGAYILEFSPRETGLVGLISQGKTSKEIASTWGLTPKSIETYRSRLLEKVGVKNTSELLNYFHQNGLL